MYNARTDRSPCLKNADTTSRVVNHTAHQPSAQWRSEGAEKFAQVLERDRLQCQYISDSKMGARERMELERMMQVGAARLPAAAAVRGLPGRACAQFFASLPRNRRCGVWLVGYPSQACKAF